jgi:hypothetical protein
MIEYFALAMERTPVDFRGEVSPLLRTSLRVAPLCGGSAPATPPGLATQRPRAFSGQFPESLPKVVFIPEGV